MEPHFIVFYFDSILQILSGILLILLITSYIGYLRLCKQQKEKLAHLEKLIVEIEQSHYKNEP